MKKYATPRKATGKTPKVSPHEKSMVLTVNSIDPIGGDGAIGRITKVWW
jgi:hypothetical protein